MSLSTKSESNGKLYESYRQFFLRTAVLMGANNDNETLRAVDEVMDLQYKIDNVCITLKRIMVFLIVAGT